MRARREHSRGACAPLIEANAVSIVTPEGRELFRDLRLHLSEEKAVLSGRNGVGKSTLLEILSGNAKPQKGEVILREKPHFVRQDLGPFPNRDGLGAIMERLFQVADSAKYLEQAFVDAGLRPPEALVRAGALSHGEYRKIKLIEARLSRPALLLLDEPTQDLDERGALWLIEWLARWRGGLLVVSHDVRLLRKFEYFLVIAETGCRCFTGSFEKLMEELDRDHAAAELRYVRNLNRLIEREEHMFHIARRRARKRQYGRVSELGRATPRKTLNQKRDYAQIKHGRMQKAREVRILELREWTRATRRALAVNLPFCLPAPCLSLVDRGPVVRLERVSSVVEGRCLFADISLGRMRERLGVTGANGAGKTTLLEMILLRRSPTSGSVFSDTSRIGSIAQGGADWMKDESLFEFLNLQCSAPSTDIIARFLVSHKFPLALAKRPIYSLSPGERVRAALICLFHRVPVPDLLVLDEPTYSLDISGRQALTNALKIWPGGLIVASHDPGFLTAIGTTETINLGDSGIEQARASSLK